MTNQELEVKLERLVKTERKTTLEILQLIQRAEDRRLALSQGFSSTHEWLRKKYGYSGSAANRRVQAARYLRSVAKGNELLEKGEVNLTTLAKAQSAIVREEKRTGERMPTARKEEVLAQVTGKTEEAAEKALFALFPEEAKKESLRPINGEEARLSVVLGEETVETLKKVRDLLSHALPGASWAEVIAYLAHDFTRRKTAPVSHGITKKRCEYKDPETGRQCGSTYQLEVDHIQPRSLGGKNEPGNMRCLCKRHNLFEAEQKLSRAFMQKFRRVQFRTLDGNSGERCPRAIPNNRAPEQ